MMIVDCGQKSKPYDLLKNRLFYPLIIAAEHQIIEGMNFLCNEMYKFFVHHMTRPMQRLTSMPYTPLYLVEVNFEYAKKS